MAHAVPVVAVAALDTSELAVEDMTVAAEGVHPGRFLQYSNCLFIMSLARSQIL
jgi:hypothetical protein